MSPGGVNCGVLANGRRSGAGAPDRASQPCYSTGALPSAGALAAAAAASAAAWAAFAAFVPLFIHFCLRYPVRSEVFGEKRWRTMLLYLPAALFTATAKLVTLLPLLPFDSLASSINSAVVNFKFWPRYNLALLIHFVIGVALGSAVLLWRFLVTRQATVRQRLKWAMWGTIVSVVPILMFQIARRFVYLPEDTFTVALTTLPLALIPLSFGHSVVRYRLMDVDVVVRRAFVYAATTVAIARGGRSCW